MTKTPEYPCAFIPDGYTDTKTIAGVAGAFPPCTVTYRPFRGIMRSYWYSKAYAPQLTQEGEVDEMLAKRLESWDLSGADGSIAKITPGNLANLHGQLYTAILDIVFGIDRDQELAELMGKPKKETEEATDAKN